MNNTTYLSQFVEKLTLLPDGMGFFVVMGIVSFLALVLAFIYSFISQKEQEQTE